MRRNSMANREKELAYSVGRFRRALDRFSEALQQEKNDLRIDASIQRFEFTFELAWKTAKRALLVEGIICKTPRECLKESFRLGLIKNEEEWLAMLDDRNAMSHIYSEEEARIIFARLPDYLKAFENLYRAIKQKFGL